MSKHENGNTDIATAAAAYEAAMRRKMPADVARCLSMSDEEAAATRITSLDGLPSSIKGDFNVGGNSLVSLNNVPKTIGPSCGFTAGHEEYHAGVQQGQAHLGKRTARDTAAHKPVNNG